MKNRVKVLQLGPSLIFDAQNMVNCLEGAGEVPRDMRTPLVSCEESEQFAVVSQSFSWLYRKRKSTLGKQNILQGTVRSWPNDWLWSQRKLDYWLQYKWCWWTHNMLHAIFQKRELTEGLLTFFVWKAFAISCACSQTHISTLISTKILHGNILIVPWMTIRNSGIYSFCFYIFCVHLVGIGLMPPKTQKDAPSIYCLPHLAPLLNYIGPWYVLFITTSFYIKFIIAIISPEETDLIITYRMWFNTQY